MVNAKERRSDQTKPPEKGNGVKGAQKKQRLPGWIEQKHRERGELKRRLQDKDARGKRALAKEAKGAERKEYREERAQLRALAKEFCSEHANRPRPRKKAASSEAELRKLGGVKEMVRRKDGPPGPDCLWRSRRHTFHIHAIPWRVDGCVRRQASARRRT
jgi:hypothetical protein